MKHLLIKLTILGVIYLQAACQYIEEPHTYHENYTPKLHNGGWVPNIFPNDIAAIHEQHDIDTNEVWLKFSTNKIKINTDSFELLDVKEITKIKIRKPNYTSWWFEGLIQQQPSNDAALNAQVFRGKCGKRKVSYLAISKTNNTNYWWCQSE